MHLLNSLTNYSPTFPFPLRTSPLPTPPSSKSHHYCRTKLFLGCPFCRTTTLSLMQRRAKGLKFRDQLKMLERLERLRMLRTLGILGILGMLGMLGMRAMLAMVATLRSQNHMHIRLHGVVTEV